MNSQLRQPERTYSDKEIGKLWLQIFTVIVIVELGAAALPLLLAVTGIVITELGQLPLIEGLLLLLSGGVFTLVPFVAPAAGWDSRSRWIFALLVGTVFLFGLGMLFYWTGHNRATCPTCLTIPGL